jgi:sodium-dependent phosphate transporter
MRAFGNTGVVVIVASWFISPLMAGIMSYLLYWVLRVAVLRGEGSYKKAIFCLPVLLFITLFVNMFFILYKVRWSCRFKMKF